jgi:hypothetical protein
MLRFEPSLYLRQVGVAFLLPVLLRQWRLIRLHRNDGLASARRLLITRLGPSFVSATQFGIDVFWLGHRPQARELQEETLGQRRRILGEDHPDTLTSASKPRHGHVVPG